MSVLKDACVDKLHYRIFSTRQEMGAAAAAEAAKLLKTLLAAKDELNVLFAAAPSQNEFLTSILSDPDVDWSRINGFHMDEYIGLDEAHPAGFRNFLRAHIFSKAPFKSVHYLNGNAPDPEAEAVRYSALLKKYPLDVCFMGIGENGHIAFNDPPVADFNDPTLVKTVELEHRCRIQQVNDGCFAVLDDVPTHALSVTIPGMMAAGYLFCMVPAPTKAEAVQKTLIGPIAATCPASILRTHDHAELYLDADSGRYVL